MAVNTMVPGYYYRAAAHRADALRGELEGLGLCATDVVVAIPAWVDVRHRAVLSD